MNANADKPASKERETYAFNGWLMVQVNLVLLFGAIGYYWHIRDKGLNESKH